MSEAPRFIAVVDIGKTNAKMVLHDLNERHDLAVRSLPNAPRRDGPYPHYDTDALFAFILESLTEFAAAHPIDAISITAHGASAVLIGEHDLALPVLDYEAALEGVEGYETLRPPFSETLSPPMANGLNVGRQLFWLQARFPERFAKARHILTYPQYWAFRLTGIAACEPSSLGCHTDLWAPERGDFSSLVDRAGWRPLFAPLRRPFDVLGPLKPEWAERIGLAGREIPVLCGIHDSNASLLPHLLALPAPFAVVSTGTWVVSFAIGGRKTALDASRNMLAYVDAFGRPVPSALFMGGREFDILTDRAPAPPDEAALARVIEQGLMVRPPIVPNTGPFPDGKGDWSEPAEDLSAMVRTAAASLYVALMTTESLALIGANGPIVVEGPFARNLPFLRALGQLTDRPIFAPTDGTGTSAGAALLALGPEVAVAGRPTEQPVDLVPIMGLDAYAAKWRNALAEQGDALP
ncbi:FGGY-family carbohydrate kinase [Aureimonas sp. AU40]|uniref:FGGY-family carbohydrate kinase n=1 Tax=Aureimonas sp. AU40 TaxID=1637747 RepID=UPI0007807455|nr:FGGY family carbohydrate kinase [Aureimonas sp. AU40]